MSRIKELREAKNWTQRDLSERSGVSQSAISDIESGKRDPNFSSITKIAHALGVSVMELQPEEAGR